MHTSVASMGIAGMILLVWDRKGLFPARGVEQFKSAVQWSRKKFGNTAFFACIQLHDRPRQAVKSAGSEVKGVEIAGSAIR
jgi:hypothetical protein